MAQLRRTVSDLSLAAALVAGFGMAMAPAAASAAPDDDDEDLVIDDDDEDEDYDELDEDYDEDEDGELDDEDYEDPFGEDGDDDGASASGSASASLGGGAKADGKAKRKKREKKPRKKDDRPFFERYRPTNHMINAGISIGGFWRANNHGLFDRSVGPQPSTERGNFDIDFRVEYMPIPYVGAGLEVGVMPTSSSSEGGAKANFYTVRAHAIGQLPYRLTPTLAIGGGLLALSSRNAEILNGGDPAFHWGPGAKFYINEWVAVRLDGRHMVTGGGIDGERSHHGELLVGAEVNIRLTRWVGEKWRAQRADRDGDTVADFFDECPDEYGEDENGCPLNRDSDNDGMPDRRDDCPNEWGDGPDGCPVPDIDGDGILDVDDGCEEEPENYNGYEDTDGCPDELPDEITSFEGVLKGVYFDTGKSTIRRKSRRVLDRVVKVLEKYEQVRVEISGHTDSKGSHEDNLKLSQERADAVKQYLVDAGIEESRVFTRGAGPDEPIADNENKRGRQKNRRIEFKLR